MQTDGNAEFEVFEHTGYERMPYERVGSINLATGENDFGALVCPHCDEEFTGPEDIEDRTWADFDK
jgi:hypothetical protein